MQKKQKKNIYYISILLWKKAIGKNVQNVDKLNWLIIVIFQKITQVKMAITAFVKLVEIKCGKEKNYLKMATKYCEKCGRTLKDIEFYQYKDGSKTELCKKCLTMHINNFDPSTF